MDGTSFGSLAQLKILLLPVGKLSKQTFDTWADLIRSFEHLRLDEVTPDAREDKSRFMPTPLSTGYLHLSYPTRAPPAAHTALSLFRPSHFPLGAIGIATCSQTSPFNSVLAEFNSTLKDHFPPGSPFPLATRCYAFEEGDTPSNISLGERDSQLVVIPGVMGNKKLYVGTLISELCAEILGDFTGLAKALESDVGLAAVNAKLLPTLSQTEWDAPDLPSFSFEGRLNGTASAIPHSSSLSAINSGRNSAELRSMSPVNGTRPAPKRSQTIMSSSSTSTLGPPMSASKKRYSLNATPGSSGRVNKITADLYLLAGRTGDAVQWYLESLPMLKGSQDVIWQASAIEGMCVAEIIDSWASSEAILPSPPGGKHPWMDMSERLNQAIALYARATPIMASPTPSSPSQHDNEYGTLSLLCCQSIMRLSHFLLASWSAEQWGKAAFEYMLQPNLAPEIPLPLPESVSSKIAANTGLDRSTIAGVIAQAHGPHILHLQVHDRIQLLNTMAAYYSYLGFHRKEVYILRELLAAVMDALVTAREEPVFSAADGKAALAGLGIVGVKTPNGIVPNMKSPATVAIRPVVNETGNDSILRVVRYVCDVYGVDLTKVGISDPGVPLEKLRESGEQDAEGLNQAEEEERQSYGWPELQIGAVREAVAIAEALPNFPAVAQFSLSTLKHLHKHLSISEQVHLHTSSLRALATARRRGDDRRVHYWASRPVLSLEVTPLPLIRLPVEHAASDLEPQIATASEAVVIGRRDPFIYNPRLKSSSAAQVVAVQNESLEFVLTLFNTLGFDVELPNITLSATGVRFETSSTSTSIPSGSYRVLRISGTPLEPGTLVVRGIVAQLVGGAPQEFLLPLANEDADKLAERRRSVLDAESIRTKSSGLDARSQVRSLKQRTLLEGLKLKASGSAQFLTCQVVEDQPFLRIRRSTLTHGALTLYDGERTVIRLTLENNSPVMVDFIKLTFDDSTIPMAQQALSEGELSVAETYETEYDLLHNPVFSCEALTQSQIAPDRKTVVAITSRGKFGCTNGTIQISYAYARRQRTVPVDVFHTRQILYPVSITVYRTLECQGMDITPFWNSHLAEGAEETQSSLWSIAHRDHREWCIFSVDVSNHHDGPFEVVFERVQEGVPRATASRLVAPGATIRMILPMRRLHLTQDDISRPVPTLSNRQFVVSKEKLNAVEERAQRELFWCRESLLSGIKAYWREPGTSRHGSVSLRNQRLTLPMLTALRASQCRVDLTILDRKTGEPLQQKGTPYIAPLYQYITLRATVYNTSDTSLPLTLSYIPPTPSSFDSVLFDTSPTRIPLGIIQPGEMMTCNTGLSPLDVGRFDFKAILERSTGEPIHDVDADISIIVETEF